MSRKAPNEESCAKRTRELKSRLLPRQQAHMKPLTLGGIAGIVRPATRSTIRTTGTSKLPPLPVVAKCRDQNALPTKREQEAALEDTLRTMKDPFEFIEFAKKNNLVNEFVYLYPIDIIEDADNPTCLRIIPSEQASREEFWNLSLKGLTHVKGGVVDFIPLDEWLQSLKVFSKMLKIPFFKYQRQWRMFKLWKSQMFHEKMSVARSGLNHELFFAHAVLRPAFIQIQRELHKLSQTKLFSIKPGYLYTMDAFVEENQAYREKISAIFEAFFEKLVRILQDAFERTIEALHLPERAKADASSLEVMIAHYEKHRNKHSKAMEVEPSSLSYTEKASRIAVCEKIARFIRMVDYVVITNLRNLCVVSLLEFYGVLEALHKRGTKRYSFESVETKIEPLELPIEFSRVYQLIQQRTHELFDAPAFRVEVSYEGGLVWSPADTDVVSRIHLVRNDFIDILFKVPRLVGNPLFRGYIIVDRAGEKDRKVEGPDLGRIIFNDAIYKETTKKQNLVVRAAFELLDHYSTSFQEAIGIYQSNQKFNTDFMDVEGITADDVRKVIHDLREQEGCLRTLVEKAEVGIFGCNSAQMKQMFLLGPGQCIQQIKQKLPELTKKFVREYGISVRKAYSELSDKIIDVASFVGYLHACDRHQDDAQVLDQQCEVIQDFYTLASEQSVYLSADEQAEYQSLVGIHEQIREILRKSQDTKHDWMPRYVTMLDKHIIDLHEEAKEAKKLAANPKLSDVNTTPSEAATILVVLIGKTDRLHTLAQNYNTYQQTMAVPKTKFDDIRELVREVHLKQLTWETYTTWQTVTNEWFSMSFKAIDSTLMAGQLKELRSNALIAAKGLPNNAAADEFCAKITDFSNLIPVVEDLKNPALKQTHMDQIETLLGAHIFDMEEFTFKTLFDLQAFNYVDQIHLISTQATHEQKLDDILDTVRKDINGLTFTVTPMKSMKNMYYLEGFERIFSVIDNAKTMIASVKSSHYVSQVKSSADEWTRSLKKFGACMKRVKRCQELYVFVTHILVSPDITRAVADETKEMGHVERTWRSFGARANEIPNAYALSLGEQTQGDLETAIAVMERIKSGVAKYLDIKRTGFPRLFFLSDDEVLDLIAKSKDPTTIVPYVARLFDGISELEFHVENMVTSITSASNPQGEKLAIRGIKLRSNVEVWLENIEQQSQKQLRLEIKNAMSQFTEMVKEDWMQATLLQVAAVVASIDFTTRLSTALTAPDVPNALSLLLKETQHGIRTFTKVARLELSALDRVKSQVMLTLELHARDIVKHLIGQQVTDGNSYQVTKHMAFRWDEGSKDVIIEQCGYSFKYGFEFLAGKTRMVITPLTDRCMLSLTHAMAHNFGGALFGDVSSGKTETIRELARYFAVFCLTANCNAQISVPQLTLLLRGVIQSGSWMLLDNFQLLSGYVVSVIAEQIHIFYQARIAGLKKLDFEGKEIHFHPQTNIFLTTWWAPNSSALIPDSVRGLFRPIALLRNDAAAVLSASLLSQGFVEAKRLTIKLLGLLKVAKEQLAIGAKDSFQIGGRTLKSILNVTMKLKWERKEMTEEQIVLTALKMVIPKMLSRNDANLFMSLLSSFFSGTESIDTTNSAVSNAIQEACSMMGVQCPQTFLDKALSLYDTLEMHAGVVVVGNMCCGKSTLIDVVLTAFTSVREKKSPENVEKKVICPKTLSLEELYGHVDPETLGWQEGVISRLFGKEEQECEDCEQKDEWIVFDGVLDSEWMDNLNTALEDCRVLILNNSKRVPITDYIHFLFETSRIDHASPASLSRCGVVHVDSMVLSWKMVMAVLLETQVKEALGNKSQLINKFEEFIDLAMDSTLGFLKEHEEHGCHLSPIGCLHNFVKLFVVMCGAEEFKATYAPKSMSGIFAFCFSWSFGGQFDVQRRNQFDALIRDVYTNAMTLPSRTSVFDATFDISTGEWGQWSDKVQSFVLTADDEFEIDPGNIKCYNILVPTVETVRMSFLLQTLLKSQINVMLFGLPGSGKRRIIRTVLKNLQDSGEMIYNSMQFTPFSRIDKLHRIFKYLFEQRSDNVFQAAGGARSILYIQDMNSPKTDYAGESMLLETIRQMVAHRGYRPPPSFDWYNVNNITLCGVCQSSAVVPKSLSRHAFCVEISPPDANTMFSIVHSVWQLFFRSYRESVKSIVAKLASALLSTHESICQTFTAVSEHPYYSFNMHDIMNVTYSLLRATPKRMNAPVALEKLWCHEVFRVYSDRMATESDKRKFDEIMAIALRKRLNVQETTTSMFSPVFGDFPVDASGKKIDSMDRCYREFPSIDAAGEILSEMAREYSSNRRGLHDPIVLFDHYARHVARVVRVLKRPRGHLLLLGTPGSGKKSIAKFGAYVADCDISELEYASSFRDDMKALMMKCGINGKEVAVLLNDGIMKNPSVIDDVTSIINATDILSFFTPEDIEKICGDMILFARSCGENEAHENLLSMFSERVLHHLHIIMSLSPSQRTYFVVLRDCIAFRYMTQIDFYEEWPESAFIYYASLRFAGEKLSNDPDQVDALTSKLAEASYFAYRTVQEWAEKLRQEANRNYFTMPALFMRFLAFFLHHVQQQRRRQEVKMEKLWAGIDRYNKTVEFAEQLRGQKENLAVEVAELKKHDQDLASNIDRQVATSEELQTAIKQHEEEAKKKKGEAEEMAKLADQELEKVLPTLMKCEAAMNSLQRADLNELKAMVEPPPAVRAVMEVICIMIQQEPNWRSAVAILSDPLFISKILSRFNEKNRIPEPTLERVKQYISNNMPFEQASSGAYSVATRVICNWIKAIVEYETVYKEVEPQRKVFLSHSKSIEDTESLLRENQDKVKNVGDAIENLNQDKEETIREIRRTTEMLSDASAKLRRFDIFVRGISEYKNEWTANLEKLREQNKYLVGDCFMNSVYFTFLGPFPYDFRAEVKKIIEEKTRELGIEISPDYSLLSSVHEPHLMTDLESLGLGRDEATSENAILILNAPTTPYVIDPYGHAMKWIKLHEMRDRQMINIKQTAPNLLKMLEANVKSTITVVIEDMSATTDPAMDHLLARRSFSASEGKNWMKIGERTVEIDDKFRLFLTTKLDNPALTSELFSKATVISFIPTKQMLIREGGRTTFAMELPELEKKRAELTENVSTKKKSVHQIETRILELLINSGDAMLDDDVLVKTIEASRDNCVTLKGQIEKDEQELAELTQKEVQFEVVSKRLGVFYEVAHLLSKLNPMYMFPYEFFRGHSKRAVQVAAASDDPEQRLRNLTTAVTETLFKNMSNTLFRKHRLLLAFLVTAKILVDDGKVPEELWRVFLYGVPTATSPFENPLPQLIDGKQWHSLHATSQAIQKMKSLPARFVSDTESLRQFLLSSPDDPLPELFQSFTSFEILILAKVLKPDKFVTYVTKFVSDNLGSEYLQQVMLDIDAVYHLSSPQVPICFATRGAVEPRSYLDELARKHGLAGNVVMKSLGQPSLKIDELVNLSASRGDWLFIQDLHISPSLASELESVILKLSKNAAHPGFRLFMSTQPSSDLPGSLIRKSVIAALERPSTIKEEMTRMMNCVEDDMFDKGKWTQISFQIAMLYSFLDVSGTRGGSINTPYSFSPDDLNYIIRILKRKFDDAIDFSYIHWAIMELGAGACVADFWSRRTMRLLMEYHISDAGLERDASGGTGQIYCFPSETTRESILSSVERMPNHDRGVLGISLEHKLVHKSRQIIRQLSKTSGLFGLYLPKQETVLALLRDLESRVPVLDDISEANEDLVFTDPTLYILTKESKFYQSVINVMVESLRQCNALVKGVQGRTVDAIDDIIPIIKGKIPKRWHKYPSTRNLDKWIADLNARVDFINNWVRRGSLPWFWLGAFSRPKAFLDAIVLRSARALECEVHELSFDVEFVVNEPTTNTTEGVCIGGLHGHNMKWDGEKKVFVPCSGIMESNMPFVRLIPVTTPREKVGPVYKAPVYQFMGRKRDKTVNFVMEIDLPSLEEPEMYILMGSAIYLNFGE